MDLHPTFVANASRVNDRLIRWVLQSLGQSPRLGLVGPALFLRSYYCCALVVHLFYWWVLC